MTAGTINHATPLHKHTQAFGFDGFDGRRLTPRTPACRARESRMTDPSTMAADVVLSCLLLPAFCKVALPLAFFEYCCGRVGRCCNRRARRRGFAARASAECTPTLCCTGGSSNTQQIWKLTCPRFAIKFPHRVQQ